MKKVNKIISFGFLLLINNILFSQWQCVGSPCISTVTDAAAKHANLAIENGIPYLIYQDEIYLNHATVKKYNGSTWEIVGNPGFSAAPIFMSAIAIKNGTPFVAYSDASIGDKITVMKFDSSNWINVGSSGFSNGKASHISLIFVENDLHAVFSDDANGDKLTVMKYDGENWMNVGSPAFSQGMAVGTSMAYNGDLYVAFADGANGYKVSTMKYNGSNWVYVGNPGFSAGTVNYKTSIAIHNSTPFVVYADNSFSDKATVMKFDGLNWVNVSFPGFTAGAVDNPQIAFSQQGLLHIAYRDLFNCANPGSSRGSVMKFDNESWEFLGDPCFTSEFVNVTSFVQSLVFDENNAYVAFNSTCGSYTKSNVMKFEGEQSSATINENEVANEIIVAPNPTNSFFSIKSFANSHLNLNIINLSGKRIMYIEGVKANEIIDISNLAAGVYFIEIAGEKIFERTRLIRN